MDPSFHADASPSPPAAPRRRDALWGLLRFTLMAATIASVITLVLHHSGLSMEILARVLPPTPLEAGKFAPAREVDLPKSPFLEAARRTDGSLNPWLLEARYYAAGLSQAQALDVARYLPSLSPVIIVVDDPTLEAQLRQEAKQAADALQKRYPHAFQRLSIHPQRGEEFSTAQWVDFQAALLGQGHDPYPEDLPRANRAAFKAAREELHRAATRAGLRALRVAPANYTTPRSLRLQALRLDAANEALQRATGWSGGVLGLNGRVELRMGTPHGGEHLGYTQAARTLGRLRITGRHDTLAHEWLHALDFVLAREAFAAPTHTTLSEQDALLRIHKNPAILHAWNHARQGLETAAPGWMSARRAAAARKADIYWLRTSEQMAFAFQAHVARQSPMLALPHALERYNIITPYAYPTPQELDRQDPVWSTLFAALPRRTLVRAP